MTSQLVRTMDICWKLEADVNVNVWKDLEGTAVLKLIAHQVSIIQAHNFLSHLARSFSLAISYRAMTHTQFSELNFYHGRDKGK